MAGHFSLTKAPEPRNRIGFGISPKGLSAVLVVQYRIWIDMLAAAPLGPYLIGTGAIGWCAAKLVQCTPGRPAGTCHGR